METHRRAIPACCSRRGLRRSGGRSRSRDAADPHVAGIRCGAWRSHARTGDPGGEGRRGRFEIRDDRGDGGGELGGGAQNRIVGREFAAAEDGARRGGSELGARRDGGGQGRGSCGPGSDVDLVRRAHHRATTASGRQSTTRQRLQRTWRGRRSCCGSTSVSGMGRRRFGRVISPTSTCRSMRTIGVDAAQTFTDLKIPFIASRYGKLTFGWQSSGGYRWERASSQWLRVRSSMRMDGCFWRDGRKGGRWRAFGNFPGGKLEAGETPEAALVRELKEELGIEVWPACLAPFTFASHAYEDFHLLMPLYVCRKWGGDVVGAGRARVDLGAGQPAR